MDAATRRVAIILNPSSGVDRKGTPEDQVRAAFEAAGIHPEIIPLSPGLDVGRVVAGKVAAGFNVVVAAGGDGTVGSVASALVGTATALGVLPTGTLNHFAKDLHLPLELAPAALAIAQGKTASIDVAEVNGRVFLNNSSIGLYPTMVMERERLMSRGYPKHLAMCRAALTALWRFPNTSVRLTMGGAGMSARTPLVFVGNNQYEFAGLEAGTRSKLHEGILQLCTVDNPSRTALFRALILAMIGKAGDIPDLHAVHTETVRIDAFRRKVRVAIDGEVVRMTSPLIYKIRPAALNVIVAETPESNPIANSDAKPQAGA